MAQPKILRKWRRSYRGKYEPGGSSTTTRLKSTLTTFFPLTMRALPKDQNSCKWSINGRQKRQKSKPKVTKQMALNLDTRIPAIVMLRIVFHSHFATGSFKISR